MPHVSRIRCSRTSVAAKIFRKEHDAVHSYVDAPDNANDAPISAYFNVVHPDDVDAVRAAIDQSLASGEPYYEQFRVCDAGGRVRVLQARGTVETDARGRPQQMSGAMLDVTHRQQAEVARRFSESRFRTIAESNVIGIIRYRFDGTIVEANDAFLHMLGFSREHFELHGLSWRELTPPERDETGRRAWASLHATGRMELIEKEFFRSDGSRVPIYMGAANFEGLRDEGMAYILDISEVKKSEAALRSSELTSSRARRTRGGAIPQTDRR